MKGKMWESRQGSKNTRFNRTVKTSNHSSQKMLKTFNVLKEK
jgi:hypothetical protein